MSMKWITLDSSRIVNETLERDRRMNRTSVISPFNVPSKLGYEFDGQVFTIVFSYIGGDEKTQRIDGGNGFVFHIGKTSQRLYRIEANVAVIQEALAESLPHSIDDFKQSRQPRFQGSYTAAHQVFGKGGVDISWLQAAH